MKRFRKCDTAKYKKSRTRKKPKEMKFFDIDGVDPDDFVRIMEEKGCTVVKRVDGSVDITNMTEESHELVKSLRNITKKFREEIRDPMLRKLLNSSKA